MAGELHQVKGSIIASLAHFFVQSLRNCNLTAKPGQTGILNEVLHESRRHPLDLNYISICE